MEVRDHLATVGTHVHERPVAGLIDTHEARNPHDELEQGVSFAVLPLLQIVQGGDVPLGNHEHVLWSLGVDVTKSEERVVLEDHVAGDVPGRYPTENTVVHWPDYTTNPVGQAG